MNIQNLLNYSSKILNKSSICSAKLDSEILLQNVIQKDKRYLILNSQKEIKKTKIKLFKNLINRRKKGEPISYIIKRKEFWKENFFVNKHVLIPRPDSEILVEQILKIYDKNSKKKVLDIGTGSGCILLSLLKERKNFFGIGIDISKNALNVATFNAKVHQLSNRVKFYNSGVDKFLLDKYDLIVSNPPYIKKCKLKYLDRGIVGYEPRIALDGGHSGYSKITEVINRSSSLIKRNGKFILEMGFDQKKVVLNILKKNGFYVNKVYKDYGNNDRCIISTKI
jgi:release factor glutamine methyltransferase